MSRSPYPTVLLDRHLYTGDDPHAGSGRSPFERDRDRILYSSAFRALANKTQVVAAGEVGYIHNRLTHSLKVAQLGRGIASRLRGAGSGIDPALVEAACLAHDIGHPPFGHAGEKALGAAVDKRRREELGLGRGDPLREPLDGFEGNAQNLRVLCRLATHRLHEVPGLHLTRGTLAAAIKYPWERESAGYKSEKWGAYTGDREALEWVLEARSQDDPYRPVEADVMDWADDVTYAVHDVEDWYRQGQIPLDQLFNFDLPPGHRGAGHEETPPLSEFLDAVEGKWQGRGKHADVARTDMVVELHRLADRVSVVSAFDGTRQSKGLLHATVSDLISYFADNARLEGDGVGYAARLVVDPDRRFLCDLLKELVWFYVIDQNALAAQQHGQARIVRSLFRWVGEEPTRLLPPDRREELDQHGDLTRAAADHVASLTEPLAVRLYGKLSGNDLGWITDTV